MYLSRRARIINYFKNGVNPVIRFLILSDTVIIGAAGLLGPIFALFIEDFIQGGNETVAGIAAAIYLFTKSSLQVPIAHLIDRVRGEKDDFWLMFSCTIIMALIPILYLFIDSPIQLYAVQFVLGLFTAITFPTYMAIFTRHIDHKKEGTEWGLYFTLTDLTSAALAAVGGYVASEEGFYTLIIVVVVLSVLGSLLLYPIKPYIKLRT